MRSAAVRTCCICLRTHSHARARIVCASPKWGMSARFSVHQQANIGKHAAQELRQCAAGGDDDLDVDGSASSCDDTLEGQSVTLSGTLTQAEYTYRYEPGRGPVIGDDRFEFDPKDLGTLTLKLDTCKSGGEWTILNSWIQAKYTTLNNELFPTDGSYGWGITPLRAIAPGAEAGLPDGGLVIQAFYCNKNSDPDATLLGIPLPWKKATIPLDKIIKAKKIVVDPYAFSVAQAGAAKALSDAPSRNCGAVAREMTIKIDISAAGRVSLAGSSSSDTESIPQPGPVENVSQVFEDSVTVTAA